MILAAGRGERLRPLTDTCPKPLLHVRGRPLIEWHLLQLRRIGIERVVLNLFWLGEQFAPVLGQGERFGLELVYVHEPVLLNTAGGIINALPLLGEEPFWLVNGDIFTDYPFSAPAFPKDADGELILVPNPPHHPHGDFSLDGRQVTLRDGQTYTYAGIARFSPAVFANLPVAPLPLLPVLERLIHAGRLGGQVYSGLWTDVGTPQRLAAIQ